MTMQPDLGSGKVDDGASKQGENTLIQVENNENAKDGGHHQSQSTTPHPPRPDLCLICWEDFAPEREIPVTMSCGHIVGVECLTRWMKQHHHCPICKACLHNNTTTTSPGGSSNTATVAARSTGAINSSLREGSALSPSSQHDQPTTKDRRQSGRETIECILLALVFGLWSFFIVPEAMDMAFGSSAPLPPTSQSPPPSLHPSRQSLTSPRHRRPAAAAATSHPSQTGLGGTTSQENIFRCVLAATSLLLACCAQNLEGRSQRHRTPQPHDESSYGTTDNDDKDGDGTTTTSTSRFTMLMTSTFDLLLGSYILYFALLLLTMSTALLLLLGYTLLHTLVYPLSDAALEGAVLERGDVVLENAAVGMVYLAGFLARGPLVAGCLSGLRACGRVRGTWRWVCGRWRTGGGEEG